MEGTAPPREQDLSERLVKEINKTFKKAHDQYRQAFERADEALQTQRREMAVIVVALELVEEEGASFKEAFRATAMAIDCEQTMATNGHAERWWRQ